MEFVIQCDDVCQGGVPLSDKWHRRLTLALYTRARIMPPLFHRDRFSSTTRWRERTASWSRRAPSYDFRHERTKPGISWSGIARIRLSRISDTEVRTCSLPLAFPGITRTPMSTSWAIHGFVCRSVTVLSNYSIVAPLLADSVGSRGVTTEFVGIIDEYPSRRERGTWVDFFFDFWRRRTVTV